MTKILAKYLTIMYKIILPTLLATSLLMMVYITSHAAVIEMNYHRKYENAYAKVVREHEQQVVFAKLVHSQQSWEKSGMAMKTAYYDERAKRIQLERQAKLYEMEVYSFMRRLKKDHPTIYMDMLRKMRLRDSIKFPEKHIPHPLKPKNKDKDA